VFSWITPIISEIFQRFGVTLKDSWKKTKFFRSPSSLLENPLFLGVVENVSEGAMRGGRIKIMNEPPNKYL